MKFFLPLRYSIPLVLAALGLVLVLLAFLDGLQRTEQLIESEARAQLLTFGTRVASSLERTYADRDTQGLAHILLRSASEPHLRAAAIVDAQGNILESTDVASLGKTLAEFARPWAAQALPECIATVTAMQTMDADGESLIALFPFALPAKRGDLRSQRYAALYLLSDLSEVKRINWAWHVERAWLMSGVVAIVLALVWTYFSVSVTKRLARLTDAMQRVTIGDLTDCSIAVSGHDELGRLGDGFAKMLHEIRLRRRALSASEERYRSIIQTMSEGVVTLDAQGRIITANASIARIANLSTEQFRERTAFDPRWQLCFEDGRHMPAEDNPVAQVLRSGKSVHNFVMGVYRQDGELRWVSVSCEPLLMSDVGEGGKAAATGERGVLAIISDVTERRAAELQAQRDRERLSAIVGSAMDGVICADSRFNITLFNRAAEQMFGFSAADMLGRPIHILLPERSRDSHTDSMLSFAATGATKRTMGVPGEIAGLRANGEEFPLEASISRVSVGSETILTVILRDLTERKRAEAQRELLEAQLRQSQKLQSLGTLTGGIAHDFNNILTAITGNAKLAQDELSETSLPEANHIRRSLAEIEKASLRATDLVRQVLTFSRRQEAQRNVVDLAAVTSDAIKFLRHILPAMIEIRTRLPSNLPRVAVDTTQIHQVITNLGSNAAHAIGERHGVIDVTLDYVDLTSELARASPDLHEGRYVRLTFADNGCGMDATTVERIFEPFFTTKGLGQGTGLGLSVVHGIVRNHDGAIVVNSTPGAGTRFEIYLPVSAQVAADDLEPRKQTNHSSGAGRTIVYVDDEEALVFLTVRMLERRGYVVHGFHDAQQALAYLSEHANEVDALVSDLAMPGISGFDVVRRARALREDLAIVLVSGYIRPQDAELAQQLGVRRLMLKPDTVDALAQALHEMLVAG